MKKLIFGLLFAFALCACESATDLSEVNDRLDSLEQRMSAAEALLKANESGLYIVSVQQTTDGYVFFMSDGSQVAVYNGKDGQNGSNGAAGTSLIKSIAVGDTEVTFTLTDGRTFSIPLYSALSITFDKADLELIPDYSERDVHYTIHSNLTDNITIEVVTSADILAEVVKESATTGYININTTTVTKYSRVLVFVSNGEKTILKNISLDGSAAVPDDDDTPGTEPEEAVLVITNGITRYVYPEGGELEVALETNLDYMISIAANAQSWVGVKETRALRSETVVFEIAQNDGGGRSAIVDFLNENGYIQTTLYITQQGILDDDGDPDFGFTHSGTTPEDAFTAAEAITKCIEVGTTASEEWYYIKGTVKSIKESFTEAAQYGNATFYLYDAGSDNEFYCYRIYYFNNEKYTSGVDVNVGDEVIVYGKVVNYSGNTPETQQGSAYLYSVNGQTNTETATRLWAELPAETDNPDYIHKTYYTTLANGQRVRNYSVCFDPETKVSRWVAYPLHDIYMVRGSYQAAQSNGRTNAWAFDDAVTEYNGSSYRTLSTYLSELDAYDTYTTPIIQHSWQQNVPSGAYNTNDFNKSLNLNRGHMLPSASRYNSWTTNAQTFYATNMMPQEGKFNSGAWGNAENYTRSSCCADTLYVVVGTLFEEGSVRINARERDITVPSHCYKLLLRTKDGNTKKSISEITDPDELICIGFLFKNDASSQNASMSAAAVSVAEIEARTGFTFFTNINPAIADKVKAQKKISDWPAFNN